MLLSLGRQRSKNKRITAPPARLNRPGDNIYTAMHHNPLQRILIVEKIRTALAQPSSLMSHALGALMMVLMFVGLAKSGETTAKPEPHNAYNYRSLSQEECAYTLEHIASIRARIVNGPSWIWVDESPPLFSAGHQAILDGSDGSTVVMGGQRADQIWESHLAVAMSDKPAPNAVSSNGEKLTADACKFKRNDIHVLPKRG